jgi:aspartyl-tRNA(Asn)/glutamyl-tRNA(Gln) amidotransferase subunit C
MSQKTAAPATENPSGEHSPEDSQEHSLITRADVEHVAALASLALTPDEVDSLGNDLRGILGYVAELQSLDTSGVAPLTHVSELFPHAGRVTVVREDAPAPSLERNTVMRNAPATDGIFFKVPKVIER